LSACRKEHHQALEEFVATQFLFDKQWMALRVSQWGCSCGDCAVLQVAI